jgi:hypothetical protein
VVVGGAVVIVVVVVAGGGGGITCGGGTGVEVVAGVVGVGGAVAGGVAVCRVRDSWMPTKMSDPIRINARTPAITVRCRIQDDVARLGADADEISGGNIIGEAMVTPASVSRSLIDAPVVPLLRALAKSRHLGKRSLRFLASAVDIDRSRLARSRQ